MGKNDDGKNDDGMGKAFLCALAAAAGAATVAGVSTLVKDAYEEHKRREHIYRCNRCGCWFNGNPGQILNCPQCSARTLLLHSARTLLLQ